MHSGRSAFSSLWLATSTITKSLAPSSLDRGGALQKILERVGDSTVPRLSVSSIQKAFQALGSVLEWARNNDPCDINAVEGLKPVDPVADIDKKHPYSTEDLQ